MRRIAGGLLLLLALLAVVVGAAMAIVLGPDDRTVTGPHTIDADGVAVVSEPGVISWAGPRVSVVAELPDDRPVFIGLANSVDLENYLSGTAHLSIDDYDVPWTITTSRHEGKPNLPASPTALDWWIADGAGVGGASVTFRLPDETVSLAVLALGANDLKGLEVTTSYDVRGGFGSGLGVVAVGFGAGLLGWAMVRRRPLLRHEECDTSADEPDEGTEPEENMTPVGKEAGEEAGEEVVEEVVYVYVDEQGVEHEIPAEEAHDYQVVDESELSSGAGDTSGTNRTDRTSQTDWTSWTRWWRRR